MFRCRRGWRAWPDGRPWRSFHEARCALEVRFADGDAPDVASHRHLGSFHLLLSLQDDKALRSYCDSVLAAIVDGDAAYGDELLRSLDAFLEYNGHWAHAAAQVFCHRHMLRYRIRRMEELTGRSLASQRDRSPPAREMRRQRRPVLRA